MFESRLFVWHSFEPPDGARLGQEQSGPTLAWSFDEGEDRDAQDAAERLLSALAFYLGQPAESLSYGISEATSPHEPATTRRARGDFGWALTKPPSEIVVRAEPNVRVALAYYREGLNSGSPFYRFLSFWNCLDATFRILDRGTPEDRGRMAFINSMREDVRPAWRHSPLPADLAQALYKDSRNAVAHVLRDPHQRVVDPDRSEDRVRLRAEADVLQWIAREAIDREYPQAVRLVSA
jgi:hypothetical protein